MLNKRDQITAIKVTRVGALTAVKPPRLTRGDVPLPKKRGDRGRREANIEATKFWHQGFGRITVNDHEVVPFTSRETAERMAAQAARNVGWPMKVVAVQDFWGYREMTED